MRDILRAASKTGGGSAVSMILGAAASKIMAVVLGPGGIGLYSMLSQVQQTASTIGSVGGATALVQGVASKTGAARDDYISTVFWIFSIGGFAASLGLVLGAPWLAPIALGVSDAASVWLVRFLSIPVALSVLNVYMNGVLNGFRAIGRLALAQVASAAVAAGLAYPVSEMVDSGYEIAFVALLSLMMTASLLVGFIVALRSGWLKPILHSRKEKAIKREPARHFFAIAGTTLITGMVATVALLTVRSLIVQYQGLPEAGIFNVAWTLGMVYPMVVLTSFGTYYLPTLSQMKQKVERVDLMVRVFRITTLVMVPLVTIALVANPFVVRLLYSGEFISSLDTVRWMLVADYLKSTSWVLAMPMLAYADMKAYFWSETLWYIAFIGFGLLAMAQFGDIQIIGVGFLVLYALYLLYVFYYSRTRHGFSVPIRAGAIWLAGLTVIIAAGWHTWSYTNVDWLVATFWVVVCGAFAFLALSSEERRGLARLIRLTR